MINSIKTEIESSIALKKKILQDRKLLSEIQTAAEEMIKSIESGNKIIFCGNGGSAADSQHLAAEFVGRFKKERDSLPAMALSVNTSILTAIGNDYGYDEVFSRQVSSMANEGDVLVGISTSGNSANIIRAVEAAKEKGVKVILLLGKDGGLMAKYKNSDIVLVAKSSSTARIQEAHIMIGHILCGLVEESIFPSNE